METTKNETLNAKLRNMVQPIMTLLDVLDELQWKSLTNERKTRIIELIPTLIEDAKESVYRLIN